MATQDKLLKSLECLKNLTNPNQTSDSLSRRKEKIFHCNVITEAISTSTIKIAPNFNQLLSFTMEILLQLCDDPESDIRMVADECLNRTIRAMSTTNISKIIIELHKEIKKNGSARSLRAALWRFALLAHHIRPVKGRLYVINLMPYLIKIAERNEDLVHETFANSLPKIMAALGCFTTDNDVKGLLKAFLANIPHVSPVIRRSAASCILAVCLHCRKPYVFISYVLNNLVDMLIPIQNSHSSALILGVTGCLKSILPHLTNTEKEQEIQGSFGVRRETNEAPLALDQLLQIYELCLHYFTHSDHNVINASLELFNILLQNCPSQLKSILLNTNGINRSRIFSYENLSKYKMRSPSVLSVATTLMSESEILLDPDIRDTTSDIQKWINESKLSVDDVSFSESKESTSEQDGSDTASVNTLTFDSNRDCAYSDMSIGVICDNFAMESLKSNSMADNLDKNVVASETSSERSYSQGADEKVSPESMCMKAIDIGDFRDKEVPLMYSIRLIAKHFLLTGFPGLLIPDKIVRVSVKSLALTCLGTTFHLYPEGFLRYLSKNIDSIATETDEQQLSDVLLYWNHPDPQLRGGTRILIASFLKASVIQSGGNFCQWLKDNGAPNQTDVFNMKELVKIITKGLEDESSNCVKQSLMSLNICLKYVLDSDSSLPLLPLLQTIPLIAKNPYWLVKVTLVELLCEIPYVTVHHVLGGNSSFQSKVIHNVLFELLREEDQRVRNACANAIVKIVPNLYFEQFNQKNDTVVSKAVQYTDLYLSNMSDCTIEMNLNRKHFLKSTPFPFNLVEETSYRRTEYSLSRILTKINNFLLVSQSKHFMYGCIEALCLLSNSYAATVYPKAWSCFKDLNIPQQHNLQRSNSQIISPTPTAEASISCASDLFTLCINLLTSSNIGYDLTLQHNLLKLCGNTFAGIAVQNLKPLDVTLETAPENWDMFSDKYLAELSETFLYHVLKLLSVFHHILDEVAPVLPQNKPVLPTLPTTSSLSPIKRKKSDLDKSKMISPGKLIEKNDKAERKGEGVKTNAAGYFANAPHYMKLYEILRTAYSNYKNTLDVDAADKFLSLLRVTLETLSQILEIATLTEVGKIAEEILNYLRPAFTLEPTGTVQCVQQLLKCLFGTNLTANIAEISIPSSKTDSDEEESDDNGFYSNVYQCPYISLGQCISVLRNISKTKCDGDVTIMGYLHRKEAKKVGSCTKGCDKILSSYIRIFEPIVIKSLEQYTVTSNVQLQAKVLQFLSQLVQLKVNYCLLDAEQIFIGFVLKQFEFIEKGHVQHADQLIPEIFHFLVNLSYGKQHSKSIISIPKIIQLCDGLMASGQSPITHCIPALQPIVEDIFLVRNKANTQDFKELETTREVLLSMLLRLLEYPEVMDLLTFILNDSKYCTDNLDKWTRWSRQVVEVFLPMLRQNKIRLDNVEALKTSRNLMFVLNLEVLNPLNDVLVMLMQEPPTASDSIVSVNRWFSKVIILFLIATQAKEDTLILKILETQKEYAPGSVFRDVKTTADPLNVTNISSFFDKLAPEVIFVHCIFRVIEVVTEQCITATKDDTDCGYLIELLSVFLMYCLQIFESGSHCKMANMAINLVNGEYTIPDVEEIRIDMLNMNFLKLSFFFPTLVFQWCYFLTCLNYNSRRFWSSIMQIPETYGVLEQVKDCKLAAKTHCINFEIVRVGGTIAFCDYLSDNMADGEQLSWMLVNSIELLINLHDEAPVYELISAIHRNQAVSGLFIQAIKTKCTENTDPIFKMKCLKTVENVHSAQIGSLLNLLLPEFLNSRQLSVSRVVASLASRKIELLLTMTMDEVVNQLPKDELIKIMDSLVTLKLAKKHETLISLLNKLATYFYDQSPLELDQRRTVNPEYIKKLQINKTWYLTQVKFICRLASSGSETAELLSKLEYDELVAIMSHNDFDKLILKDCILWAVNEIKKNGLREEPCLLKASIHCLLKNVAHVRCLFPKPHQVYKVTDREPTTSETKYSTKTTEIFADDTFMVFLYHIIPSLTAYVDSIPVFPTTKIPDGNFEDIIKFAVICLESVNYLVTVDKSDLNVNFVDCAVTCAEVIFKEIHLCSILALDTHVSWLCSAINSVYKLIDYLLLNEEPLPSLSKNSLRSTLENLETLSAGHACHQLSVLVAWLAKIQNFVIDIPDFLFKSIRSIVISLSRLPLVNSYILTPPIAWRSGWMPQLSGSFNTQVPPLPIDFLQEIDILEEFIYRITLLGWTSRQQFEETWMCLLSVLCYSVSEESMPDEINTAVHATSLSIQAITSLLLQTLCFPIPGNPNISKMLSVSRDKSIVTEDASTTKLKTVQNVLEFKYSECAYPTGSKKTLNNVFYNKNLEKQNDRYSYGQLSVEYLLLSAKLVDTFDEKTTAAVVYKQKEAMLEESGLDINSCLQFLLDLYSQWIRNEKTPLRILQEAVRSAIMISDLFTERAQFLWMLESFLDLSKKHMIENEVLHQYIIFGVCKSASVLSPDMETYETIKKLLVHYLKSAFLPARIASLQGLLYLIQGCLLSNTIIGGVSEEMQLFLPLAVEYVQCNLNITNNVLKQTEEHTLLVWALAFYLVENIDENHLESNFTTTVLQTTINQLSQINVTSIHNAVLKGLERILIVKKGLSGVLDKQILNLALEKLKNNNPNIALPGLQLLLSYTYTECSEYLEDVSKSGLVQTNPDHLVQSIEKVTAIFERIRKGHVFEVEVMCAILPNIFNDFFSPSDVLTKVIGEFLSTQQPHPKLLSKVVFQVFESAIKQSQLSLLQDWVIFSLSNFTQSLSVGMATWYLTCFFISASTDDWLRSFFPHIQSRIGRYEYEDRKMLCIAGVDFYKHLSSDKQKQTFIDNFQAVKDQSDTPFSDLLASL